MAARALPANILIDRLLHASDSTDAQSSLESLSKSILSNAESATNFITTSNDCLYALSTLIVQSSLPSGISLEEGQVTALELLQSLLEHSPTPQMTAKTVLLQPIQPTINSNFNSKSTLESAPLLHSLLDCLCSTNPQNTSPYPRILSLEIITKTHQLSPTLTQENLLAAPEGFHRLISLLHPQGPDTPESIRNATLLLLTNISKNSSVIRKLLLFSEGYERVLGIAVSSDVEKAVVLDCISLCRNLLVEDAGDGGCEMFFGGRDQIVIGGCVRLLDSRFFKETRHMDLATPVHKDDDLDDLLASPTSAKAKKQTFRVPRMTKDEEEICHAVFDLFSFAMEVGEANLKDNSIQRSVPAKFLQNQAVMGAILSFALYSPHMELQAPFFASVPTESVQCHALDILSQILFTVSSSCKTNDNMNNSPSLQNLFPLYEYFAGEASQPSIDRLISLCFRGSSSLISSHSRTALKHIINNENANLLILHALAPPPPDFEGDQSQQQMQPKDPIIKEMIQSLSKMQTSLETKQCILSTLEILLNNGGDTAKELLLRFPIGDTQNPPTVLMEFLFQSLEESEIPERDSILNLLCSWSYISPSSAMQTMLRFPQTLSVAPMLKDNNALAGILLGLWLNHFSSSDDSPSSPIDETSGWSKETIVQLIQSFGISKYTALMESYAKNTNESKPNGTTFKVSQPNIKISPQERKEMQETQLKMIAIIRKSLVSSLTNMTSSPSSSVSQEESEMAQLLAQYLAEISTLQSQQEESKETIKKQATEIKNLKRKFQPVTPLDEALVEQVDLTARAEQRILELEKESKAQTKRLTAVEKEKVDLEKDAKDSKQEKKDLEEELAALASSYNTLEVEFRSMKDAQNASKSGDGDSPEILALKNEVEALRGQVRAGDEWMTMAVKRMDDMAAENSTLQKQITAQATNTAVTEATQIEDLKKIHKIEVGKFTEQIKSFSSEVKKLKEEDEKVRKEHSLQVETMTQQISELVEDLNIEREKNQSEESAFTSSVETGAIQRLETKVETILKDLEEKDNLIASKEQQVSSDLALLKKECEDITIEKNNEVARLSNDLDAMKQNYKDEIEKKDVIIASLQEEANALKSNQPSSNEIGQSLSAEDFFSASPKNESLSSPGMTKEEEEGLRSELSQLREANHQAQEWMSNAYMHQESMANEIDQLRDENNTLKEDIENLRNSPGTMQAENNIPNEQYNHLVGEIDQLKKENEEFQTRISALNAQCEESSMAYGQFETKEKEIRDQCAKEIEHLSLRLEEIQESKAALDKKVLEMSGDSEALAHARAEIENLKRSISENSAEAAGMQKDIEELEKARMEINKLNDHISELQNSTNTKPGNEDTSSEIEEIKTTCQNLQNQLERLSEENKTLLSEQETYDEAMDQLKSRLSEYQDWTKTAQDRISELEEERDAADKKYEDMLLSEQMLKEKVDDLSSNVDLLQSQLDDAEQEKDSVIQQNLSELTEITEKLTKSETEHIAVTEQLNVLENERALMEQKSKNVHTEIGILVQKLVDKDLDFRLQSEEETLILLKQSVDEKYESSKQTELKVMDLEKCIKVLTEESNNTNNKSQDEVNGLKATISALENEISDRTSEAEMAISEWEDKYSDIFQQLQEQETDIALKQELMDKVSNLEDELKQAQSYSSSISSELETKIASLEVKITELQNEMTEKDDAISYCEEEAAGYLKQLSEYREKAEDALNQWKSTVDDLEDNVNTLTQQVNEQSQIIEEQKVDAENAITHWEDRCGTLEEQLDEQEKHLDEAEERIAAQEEEIVELKHSESMTRSMLEAAKSQIESLTKDIEYSNARSEEERKALIAEIESKVEQSMSLEMELDGAQSTRDDIIAKIKEYRDLLTLEQQARASTEESLRGERNRSSQLELSLNAELEAKNQLDSELKKYKTEAHMTKEKLQKLNSKQKEKEEKYKKMESEYASMQLQVGQIQGDLQDAREALTERNTDIATIKASEKATQALRRQITQIRAQLESDQVLMAQEREARYHSEQELERLKTDLALLTHAEDTLGNPINMDGKLRKLASKAADEIFRKERQEVEELRKMIDKVTDELRVAKAAEQNAEERAANLRMHASMCEQEVISTKNDVTFLNQSIQELRESESNALAILHMRIEDLERDRANMARAHMEDMEMLKAELSQINVEKDRLLHSLHESEKTNATLVVAETMSKDQGNDMKSNSAELARLKIVNAQLLAAAAETGSKTERRIREAVAANAASCEAELLLERDLRETAEKSCEEIQLQLDDLRKELTGPRSPKKEMTNENKVEKEEFDKLKSQIESLSLDCKSGEEKNYSLQDEVKKAKSTIAALKEECERLKAQSREVDRGVSFEASVASEIARLHAESSQQSNDSPSKTAIVHMNGNNISDVSREMSADEMYDVVNELKETVKVERNLYRNLLEDHEELLSVLAQQDLEIDSLRSGLEDLGGEEAVDEALRQVEANVEKRVEEHAFSN